MSSNVEVSQECPEYVQLMRIWEGTSGVSTPPSVDDYRKFSKAIQGSDYESIENLLKNWCRNVSDNADFLTLINFLRGILKDHINVNTITEDGIGLAIFKGIWQTFYYVVANFILKPPNGSYGELIAGATGVTNAVEECLEIVMPSILSCQTENNLCANVAEMWSHLSNTTRLNAKLVNSLPWRDIQVCLTQKLVNLWSYTQSDEILHAFLESQLRFYENFSVNEQVLKEWSALQSNKEDFLKNFEFCIKSLDTAKGVEKNLAVVLNNFKNILEDFERQTPPAKNKPKQNKDKTYGQLEMMNDIQSMRRVLHFLSLARSFRHDSQDVDSGFLGILLIERVLQVTGESIKNTAGSPNLSVKKRKTLEKAKVPLETLSGLRNILSHYNCFTVERKQHVENAIEVQSVLRELSKLEKVFVKALHRTEFMLFLELVAELEKICQKDSAQALFLASLRGCESFAQIDEKMRGNMSDDVVRQLHFLIQQFDIQSKVCKMEALFSSINTTDDKQEKTVDIWQELAIVKQDVAKSTLSEISEMKNIEELLQGLSMPIDNIKPYDGLNSSSTNSDDFLEKFIDAVAHKYMSKDFYDNVSRELFLGRDFPVKTVVIETLLETYGDKEFETNEERLHAVSALKLLDMVLHLRYKHDKRILDYLLDLVAKAHFEPITEKQVDYICESMGIVDEDVSAVMLIILQDMFESIWDETDRGIYIIVEKVIKTCCSKTCEQQVQQTKEDVSLKAARLKLTTHIKDIAGKKNGTLSEAEFYSCKTVVNGALTLAKAASVQSEFSCSNGRTRESDLKLLKNMASPFEKLCRSLKETKSLEEAVKSFKNYLGNIVMSTEEQSAALSCFRSIQQDGLESYVVSRIEQLQKLLKKYNIPIETKCSNNSYTAYKCNRYLRSAVEMLLLECLEILDNLYLPPSCQTGSQCCNFTFCGNISSTDLRNYLAHGNSLLESYDSEISHQTLQNAVELILNGKCIMALRKLFEDTDIYGFIKCAESKDELHTVHVGTISELYKRDVRNTVEMLQSNKDWTSIVKRYFNADSQKPIQLKQQNSVNCTLTLSLKLMADDALNLMLRNHLKQFSILVHANPEVCKHLFRNSWTLLHYAMSLKQNIVEVIDILLKLGVDVNATDDRNLTPLHLATLFKSKDAVEKLLSCKNIIVDANNVNGVTSLHIAALQGFYDIAKLLLSSKANPNVQSCSKWSALHFAVGYGNESVVELLLQKGAYPNVIGEDKWTPLHLATRQNRVDIMEILLQYSADPYASLVDNPLHASRGVIHLAASYGSPEGIKVLLDKGVSADSRCPLYKYGRCRTPLHWATIYGMEDNVKFLLSRPDVDKESRDDNGISALDFAMMYKNDASLFKLFLQNGCKLNMKAVIEIAAQGDLEMLKLLHERGADLNASVDTIQVFTPSIAAAMTGRLHILEFLLKTVNPVIDTLMYQACIYGQKTVAQYLIEEGYFPDPCRQFQGMRVTPLHTAAIYGRLALLIHLVDDLGVGIDFCDGDGNTPCMLAVQRKKWTVVNYCLKRGADVSGEKGNQMARIAAYNEQWTLAQEFFDKGASLDMHWEGSELVENMAVVVTAACKSNFLMLEYLIENRSLNLQTLPLQPLLILLATYAKQSVLHYLLTKGLDMTSPCDDNGATGLHRASLAGNVEACMFFLDDMKVQVDEVDANGCSALHYSIRGRQSDTVKYLLDQNADASLKTRKGQSPLMLALEVGFFKIIDILSQHKDLVSKETPDEEGNSFLMLTFRSVQDIYPLKKFRFWLDYMSTDLFLRNIKGETVLHLAAQRGISVDALLLLLDRAKAVTSDSKFEEFLNGRDINGNSPLMLVIMTAEDHTVVNSVEMLLKYNPDLNIQNCHQQTVLHLSLKRKDSKTLMALMQPLSEFIEQPDKSELNIADPRLVDDDGSTPLDLAQKLGNNDFVKKLINYEHGYKMYFLKDKKELNKLEVAKKVYLATLVERYSTMNPELMSNILYVKSLIKEIPNVLQLKTFRGNFAIHLAAEGGNVEVLKFLISEGSDVSAVNDLGQTVLHVSAFYGHVSAVDFLISTVGLECHIFDKRGNKPVHSAVMSGKIDVLQYLFEKGLSDVHDLDECNETSLQIATAAGSNKVIEYLLTKYDSEASPLGNCTILNEAVINENLSTVELLVGKGALTDISKSGLNGTKSPLHMAIKIENWPIAKFLIKNSTKDQLKFFLDGKGPDLLVFVAARCRLDVLELLINEAGLDPSTPGDEGQTPLISACCLGKPEVVEYLLSKNASPNAFNLITKVTALHNAAKFGRLEAVRILIDHHASVLAEDYGKRTPVHTAVFFKRWDVAIYILSRAGRTANGLFESLPLLHQEEIKKYAMDKGIDIEFLI